jgi:hypothetical protein
VARRSVWLVRRAGGGRCHPPEILWSENQVISVGNINSITIECDVSVHVNATAYLGWLRICIGGMQLGNMKGEEAMLNRTIHEIGRHRSRRPSRSDEYLSRMSDQDALRVAWNAMYQDNEIANLAQDLRDELDECAFLPGNPSFDTYGLVIIKSDSSVRIIAHEADLIDAMDTPMCATRVDIGEFNSILDSFLDLLPRMPGFDDGRH